MRLICFIISAYIFILVAYPCQDECGNHLNKHQTEKTSDSHDEECPNCSPFCCCNCCHVNTIVSIKITSDFVHVLPGIFLSSIKENGIKDISLPIWQPPKI